MADKPRNTIESTTPRRQSGFCPLAYARESGGPGMPWGAKGSLGAVVLEAYPLCRSRGGGSLGFSQLHCEGGAEAEKGVSTV